MQGAYWCGLLQSIRPGSGRSSASFSYCYPSFLAADPSVVCKVCYSALKKYEGIKETLKSITHNSITILQVCYPYGGTDRHNACLHRLSHEASHLYVICISIDLLQSMVYTPNFATVAAAATNAYLTLTATFHPESAEG